MTHHRFVTVALLLASTAAAQNCPPLGKRDSIGGPLIIDPSEVPGLRIDSAQWSIRRGQAGIGIVSTLLRVSGRIIADHDTSLEGVAVQLQGRTGTAYVIAGTFSKFYMAGRAGGSVPQTRISPLHSAELGILDSYQAGEPPARWGCPERLRIISVVPPKTATAAARDSLPTAAKPPAAPEMIAKYLQDSAQWAHIAQVLDSISRSVPTDSLYRLYHAQLLADNPVPIRSMIFCETHRPEHRYGLVPARAAIKRMEDSLWRVSEEPAVRNMEERFSNHMHRGDLGPKFECAPPGPFANRLAGVFVDFLPPKPVRP